MVGWRVMSRISSMHMYIDIPRLMTGSGDMKDSVFRVACETPNLCLMLRLTAHRVKGVPTSRGVSRHRSRRHGGRAHCIQQSNATTLAFHSRVQVRHPSDHLSLVPRMNPQLLKHFRARPPLRRRPLSRGPIVNVPVWFIHKLERKKKKRKFTTEELNEDVLV